MLIDTAYSRTSDLPLEFTVEGDGLSGASMIAFFKTSLSLPDSQAIKKGSASPLTGITFTTATSTKIIALVTLTKEELDALPDRARVYLYYDVKLIDSNDFTWQIETGKIEIVQTAKSEV